MKQKKEEIHPFLIVQGTMANQARTCLNKGDGRAREKPKRHTLRVLKRGFLIRSSRWYQPRRRPSSRVTFRRERDGKQAALANISSFNCGRVSLT